MNPRQLRGCCSIERLAALDNLMHAAAIARRGKSRRPDVETWWMRRESEVLRLRSDLLCGNWRPGPYRFFEIREPKRRMIAAAPFADRVVRSSAFPAHLISYISVLFERAGKCVLDRLDLGIRQFREGRCSFAPGEPPAILRQQRQQQV